jgi:hypothetical protein
VHVRSDTDEAQFRSGVSRIRKDAKQVCDAQKIVAKEERSCKGSVKRRPDLMKLDADEV